MALNLPGGMTLKVKVEGAKELASRFEVIPEEIKARLITEVTDLTHTLFGDVRDRVGGGVLHVISGALLGSVQERIKETRYGVVGKVLSTAGREAGYLEFGGHLKPRDIAPRNAKALHFLRGGAEVFAAVVHQPGATGRPHLAFYGALRAMNAEIIEGLEQAATIPD